MELAFKKIGKGFPLVILHGLYGSSDNWFSIGKELSEHFEVYLIDQRNHGKSPHNAIHNYTALQDDLNEFFLKYKISKAVLMGHSMGGRTAMYFAINHPEKIESLIVVDISIKAHNNLQTLDEKVTENLNIIQAMTSLNFESARSRADVNKELAYYIPDERVRQFLLKSVTRNEQNKYQWIINIEAIRNNLPEILDGIDISRHKHLGSQFNFPVLFVKGENSNYISDDDLFEIKELFPQAELVTIFGAGHWIHVDQPKLFMKSIKFFLQKN
jgi:pimeloyl-ACP methyl ester carboxylesterase